MNRKLLQLPHKCLFGESTVRASVHRKICSVHVVSVWCNRDRIFFANVYILGENVIYFIWSCYVTFLRYLFVEQQRQNRKKRTISMEQQRVIESRISAIALRRPIDERHHALPLISIASLARCPLIGTKLARYGAISDTFCTTPLTIIRISVCTI